MKKHTYFWLVMFLSISLALPVYSMAQVVTLTLEDPTGNRIVTPGIKSFAVGTDNNLVIYLDQPFNFKDLIPDISLASCTNCSIAGPAGVTATQGANLSFHVQSTDTRAVISLVAASWEIVPSTTMPTLTSTSGSAPFSWSTGSTPTGSYLAVFQALDGDQKSQLPVMINVVSSVQYAVTTTANPNGAAATLTGAGNYSAGASVTVNTTAASGFTFTNWTGGPSVSTSASYTFTMPSTITNLVANFASNSPQQYAVTTTANPTGAAATLTGAGTYNANQSVTVSTTAASGYTFNNWTEGTTPVSTSASYTFTITGNRTLTANFSGGGGGGGGGGGCPNGQLLPLNAQNTLSFGAGSQTCYIARFEGSTITSASLLVFGKDSGTNLNFTWTFPDGTTSFSGGALGTDVGGIIKVRSLQGSYPNYNHNYIPAGDHILTINSIGNSWVILTMTYN